MKQGDQIARETRKVYLTQHKKYLEDDVLFRRFLKMVSDPAYFHLQQEDFKGKHILDCGCGNTAYFEVAMSNMGVGRITCLDIGDEWIPPLKEALRRHHVPEGLTEYVSGSTDELPFSDASFDMVFSNGVLTHLIDVEQCERAVKELARVTVPGGYLYIILGPPGGLFETELLPAFRRFYRSNALFRSFIDNIKPDDFVKVAQLVADGMKKHTGEVVKFDPAKIKEHFDVDFCTYVQNFIQVPKRLVLELDETWAERVYSVNGFESPLRCRRFVERKNIRRYFAPLHYDSSSVISQMLYGPDNLEYIARKKTGQD
jgi:ubiquinone/menaquinone biosynthesis C-methylase UbiE